MLSFSVETSDENALTESPDSKTNFPVITDVASFAGIEKSLTNSVSTDALVSKCENVTSAVFALTLETCAIRMIEVTPVGAVYMTVLVAANSDVTVLKTLRLLAMY